MSSETESLIKLNYLKKTYDFMRDRMFVIINLATIGLNLYM